MSLKSVAIIPARSGSKRIKDKNISLLNGIPLLGYSISAAIQSGVFDEVFLATDSKKYAEIGMSYGAKVPSLRSGSVSGDTSPDIEWVKWAISNWNLEGSEYLAILRPTSPLRTGRCIKDAFQILSEDPTADSIRAVSLSAIHPGKMWTLNGKTISPLLPFHQNGTQWHSSQTANLPKVYFQNASMEIARVSRIIATNSISGEIVIPYFSGDYSGLDVNEPLDLEFLAFITSKYPDLLPTV